METVIIIKSDSTHINSIPEQLHDIGKKLAKLMYSTPKPYLNGKSIVVVFPNDQRRHSRDEVDNTTTVNNTSLHHIVSLQNSIRHIVRHAISHGIDIKIHEHSPPQ